METTVVNATEYRNVSLSLLSESKTSSVFRRGSRRAARSYCALEGSGLTENALVRKGVCSALAR
jgi:hypothetical protein